MSSGADPSSLVPAASQDRGSMSLLMLGLVTVVLTTVLAIVGVTSVQLSRIHLLDAADAAALDASDALVEEQLYREGVGTGVPVDDSTVIAAASAALASRPLPPRVVSWELGPGTGTPDGRTAVVELSGTATIPLLSQVLRRFGGGVSITVTSQARSDLVP